MDQLKRIAMGLGDRPSLDLQGLFAEHAAFLQQELGAPSRVKNGELIYDFTWGSISAGIDLRGGSSRMMCVYL